jgi:hypothetical protein
MATSDDELLDLLGPLDPTTREHPPAPGSARYRSILELAMQTDPIDLATTTTDTAPSGDRTVPQPHRGPTWRLVMGMAAATVGVAGGLFVVQSGDAPPAQAAVVSAADALSEITSLEGEVTTSEPGVSEGISRIRVDGDDVEITGETRYADGHIEASTFTVVDGIGYETIEGRTTSRPLGPDERLAPFGRSSAAVISAALVGSEVSEQAADTVDGVSTTRYDIRLTDASIAALSRLTPNELAWFELEYPERVRSLRVWVADDLVHQIGIVHRERVTRTRFFNFGGDVTITAPPGPYLPSNGP